MTRTKKTKILFVASEATPFVATGGLADVVGSLSKALVNTKRYDVRVILPLYEQISPALREQLEYVGNFTVQLSWRNQYCGIFRCVYSGVTYYFVDNEYYFKRRGLYGHYDDGERFAFFGKAVLDAMRFVNFYPDVMHCHDWQAASALVYLKTGYCRDPKYQFIKALFTIHNIEYQGKYDPYTRGDLFGIAAQYASIMEYNGSLNLMKGAIELSDYFSTVSPTYAVEIKDPYFAHGLDPIVRRNEHKLCGILNGIDVDYYNPATDRALAANYSAEDMAGKSVCKEQLQKLLNLPTQPDTPIIALITRLAQHKGLDLVTAVGESIVNDDVQLVVLGTGEAQYEQYFAALSAKYPNKVAAIIDFNPDLSRKIYSGADMFLMPSKSEPCGLSQMIASRYATVAIVRETGGLKDSITPYGAGGNGFTFANYNAHDMLHVIREAIALYRNRQQWHELAVRAATTDFGWGKSALDYEALYKRILE